MALILFFKDLANNLLNNFVMEDTKIRIQLGRMQIYNLENSRVYLE